MVPLEPQDNLLSIGECFIAIKKVCGLLEPEA